MNNNQITILYRTLSIIFGLISLIAGLKLIYEFYFFILNYLNK